MYSYMPLSWERTLVLSFKTQWCASWQKKWMARTCTCMCLSAHTCLVRYSTSEGLTLWWAGHLEMFGPGRTSLQKSSYPEPAQWLQRASPPLTPAGPQRQVRQWNNSSWFSYKTYIKKTQWDILKAVHLVCGQTQLFTKWSSKLF